MRFVTKDEKDRTVRLASNETFLELMNIINTKNKDLISVDIYRESYETPDGNGSKVEDKLAISYKNKCAYCERICKADIEHYRPKKRVSEDNTHEGYYWLCYEWTNLIPSCITCNRDGSKHNQFPIIGTRVYNPLLINRNLDLDSCKSYNTPLKDERPYLLHPEVDHPEHAFEFEIDPNGVGIRLVGIDIEGRGGRTINICLLNRPEVKLDRVERVVDDFKIALKCLLVQRDNNEINDDQLIEKIIDQLKMLKAFSLSEEKTHTYLRKYIIASSDNFEKIVIPFLDVKIGKIALAAFKAIEPL